MRHPFKAWVLSLSCFLALACLLAGLFSFSAKADEEPSQANRRDWKALTSLPPQGPSFGHFRTDELIVELRPERVAGVRAGLDHRGRLPGGRTGIMSLDTLGSRHGVTRIDAALSPERARRRVASSSRLERFLHLKLSNQANVLDVLEAYRKDPAVASAQLNYVYAPDLVPDDPLYGQQYSHARTEASLGWDIETGESSIVIAVIGTGVEPTHPDLASKLVAGWDFVDEDADPSPEGDGHETSVAGVAAAASNNGTGIAGVCWGCSIMPLRISYTSLHVAQAVDFARTHGAKIVNMSFGNYDPTKYGPDTIVETAVDEAYAAGVVLVASAGNDQTDAPARYPGALENVIAVAATDETDSRVWFSNFGGWVDVAAPGDDLISTTLTGFGTYVSCSGTSFSTPYVSGLAGLILSKDPSLDPRSVGIIIKSTVDEPDTGFIGRGRVNVRRALSQNGLPGLFASIESPWGGEIFQDGETLAIRGTALGDSYVLEWRDYTEGDPWEPAPPSSPWTMLGMGGPMVDGTLATLDPEDVPPGQYLLRLTVRRGAQVAEHSVAIVRESPQLDGWPIDLGASINDEPTLADLDEDSTVEVLVGQSDGNISILRHDGTSLPGWPRSAGGYVYSAPSVGDIDGDGDLEVVAVGHPQLPPARVMAWHHDGAPVAGFPFAVPGGWGSFSDPVLASFDADAALEIVIAVSDGTVHVLNAPGAVESPGWPRVVPGPVLGSPAVGDIDRDGILDIIVRSETRLDVLRADGTAAAGWPRAAEVARGPYQGPLLRDPVVVDLDGDRSLEIIDLALHFVTVWKSDGTTLFANPLWGSESAFSPAVSDITGDGNPEFFWSFNAYAWGTNGLGGTLPGWPIFVGHDVSAGMIVADLDGDAELEVGMPARNRGMYIVNGNGTFSPRPIVVGYDLQGDTPAVGDLDDDGQNELVIGGRDGWLRVLRLPGSRSNAPLEWPMGRADAMHTGHYRFRDHYTDSDNDGDPDRYDCAPADSSIHLGAAEICNGVDDDCNGIIDNSFDNDGDGVAPCTGDCDDTLATVYPGAPEICDGRNNDCASPIWPSLPAAEWVDADGDSFLACGDCDDTRPTVRPGAPQICGDGVNNNCNHPAWPSLVGTNEEDPDGDGYSECGGDCNLISGALWSAPSDVRDLVFLPPNILRWSPPASPGATSVTYALARMVSPSSFNGGWCLRWTGPSLQYLETTPPPGGEDPPPSIYYYLVRARNNCPFPYGFGPWGFSSTGDEILGPYCP